MREPRGADALSAEDRAVLSDLAVRSSHPKSHAIAETLEAKGELLRRER